MYTPPRMELTADLESMGVDACEGKALFNFHRMQYC
ncbi:Protein of unknown function [Gryllus bimaculatus]|nr:Protein of unknown function [Gryllus bimaculatus]